MTRATTWLAAAVFTAALSACGTNDITDTTEPTPTAMSVPLTIGPTATATHVPPTGVPTATTNLPPTLTATATHVPATLTPTVTATSIPSAPPSLTPTITPQAVTALFSADPLDAANPFPSDRLRDETGHVHVPVSQLDPGLPQTPAFGRARGYINLVAGQLSALTGFSTFAPIRVRFDRAVIVDAGQNPRGLLLLEYDNLDAAPVAITASAYDPESSVEIQPIVPLKPKTTYALVVTTALTDVAGSHVQTSADFAALMAGTNLTPELTAWRARLQPVIDFVGPAYGIDPGTLALLDLITTAPTTDDLVAIQHRLVTADLVPSAPVFENSPVPGLDTGIFAAGTPQFHSLAGDATNVSAVAVGSFDSFDFRGSGGAFDPDLLTGPMVPPVNHLDFYVTIPKVPPPPGGYPVVIFGHGLCQSGADVAKDLPGEIGDAPFMGVAVSALQHGRRGLCTNFFVLNNVAATREYFRQTVADFMQLERMVRNAHTAGIAPFDQADTDHVMYFGVSLGGIMGTMFMAVEPDVKVGMLSVPGGGLANVLDSHDIGGLLEPLVALTVGLPRTNAFFPRFLHRFQQMSQWVTDPADPINYAPYIIVPGAQLPSVPSKLVLAHEGIVDNTIPNRTTDDLARAMRLPDLNLTRGCMDADGCSGIWRFVMTDYGQPGLSGHSASFRIPQARAQLTAFLSSFGTMVPDAQP